VRLRPVQARAAFRAVAVVEALTWIGLITGMVLKYGPAQNEAGVHLFGPLHGAAFVAYLACVLLVRAAFRWGPGLTVLALVCSVPPFASVAFELWVERTGRLDPARVAGVSETIRQRVGA
jgi:RND superfamily putative drug exporter